jgi:hypothetical protein
MDQLPYFYSNSKEDRDEVKIIINKSDDDHNIALREVNYDDDEISR